MYCKLDQYDNEGIKITMKMLLKIESDSARMNFSGQELSVTYLPVHVP